MNRTYLKHLTASETELLLQAEPQRLVELDEDELGDLHQRMRRASRKYRTLHRRQAAAQVADDRSRGKASAKNERTAVKAEAFEVALAQVSTALGKAARASAREIKAERLAMAAGSGKAPASRSAPRRAERGRRVMTAARAAPPVRRAHRPRPRARHRPRQREPGGRQSGMPADRSGRDGSSGSESTGARRVARLCVSSTSTAR